MAMHSTLSFIKNRMHDWREDHQAGDLDPFTHQGRELIISRIASGVIIQTVSDYIGEKRTGLYLRNDDHFVINPGSELVIEAAKQFFLLPTAASGAAPVVTQEIPKEDLITLRALLAEKYTFLTGVAAGEHNTLEVLLENGERYRAWFNSSFQAFNFQESDSFRTLGAKHKTGIGIAPDGQILSIYKDGVKVSSASPKLEERAQMVRSYIEKALAVTSLYAKHGHQLGIRLVGASLEKIPEFHLEKLGRVLSLNEAISLKVNFMHADLHLQAGIDMGGPRREYLNTLFSSLTRSTDANRLLVFVKAPSGLYMPSLKDQKATILNSQEATLLEFVGATFMHCFDSHPAGVGAGAFDTTAMIGRHFDDELFQKILSLSYDNLVQQHPDFGDLIQIANQLFIREPSKRQLISVLAKQSLSDHDFEWLETVFMPDDSDYPEAMYPGSTLKDRFKNNWNLVRQKIFHESEFYQAVLPIRAIARGMMLSCVKTPVNDEAARRHRWEFLIQSSPFVLSEKIQGSIDKNKIAASILISPAIAHHQEIGKKVTWLKKWISTSATSEDIRNFLVFTTGTTSLPAGKNITITAQGIAPYLPVPKAHTCSFELELAPTPSNSLGPQFDDSTEEGFIRALGIALANPTGYQTA